MFRNAVFITLLTATCALAAADPVAFRIVFGNQRDRPADYSGSVSLTTGKIVSLRPWRFFQGDAIQPPNAWKLTIKRTRFENQPDNPRRMMTGPNIENVVPAGVVLTVEAPATATARVRTAQGDFSFPLADLSYNRALRFLRDDVIVERTPAVQQVSPPSKTEPVEQFDYPSEAIAADGTIWVAWQGYYDRGDHVYVRHSTPSGWSKTERLTEKKGDIYRTATGIDARGRVSVVWSERYGQEWDLYARRYENGAWSARQKITAAHHPNIFHRMVADGAGNLHLVWVGYDNGQSRVYWSKLSAGAWSAPTAISGPSAWNPEAAADSAGNLYVAWDSYRNGNYDIYLRKIGAGGSFGAEQQLTKSLLYQTHPSVAVDHQDRVWLAWHESGSNWGKDWTHEDPRRGTVLYRDRWPRVAVFDSGVWKEPATDLMSAVPLRYRRYVQYPRIAADASGRIWVGLQLRVETATNRADYWAAGGRWEFFLTTLEGDHWSRLMPLPESGLRPEGTLLVDPAHRGVRLLWVNANRPVFGRPSRGRPVSRHEIWSAAFAVPSPAPAPRFEPFAEPAVNTPPVHPNEDSDVARVRAYRLAINGRQLQILRGDFHRHTEISSDGAGDGSLETMFRYMIDAAGMDTGIVGDHNAGNDDEYCWWRTEKANDLFLIPGRYTPMFGYERSVPYPNGHRNIVFAHRGVRTLPLSRAERTGKINSGSVLYPYLRKNNGIAMEHSTATSQGTDWRDNDPRLEPLVELYQGYHASYEYPGAPRAESPNLRVRVHGDYKPAGFWWRALAKGLKLGVQSSSDHISTHSSYTMIYTPSRRRTDILESMRARHAYGATDNILIDYRAETADGKTYLMGDAFRATAAPNLKFKIIGTDVITKVDVIKDQKFVYHAEPNAKTVEFSFRDASPGSAASYYYLRVQQIDRNLAWSSPIWVDYRP